jgi:acetamidase/formamidase
MTVHTLDDALENLHGFFSRTLPPRLRIASGDTVVYRTRNAGWNDIPPGQTQSTGQRPEGAGHALSGPVFVADAEPGDTLEVRIKEIVPLDWGFNAHRPGNPNSRVKGLLGGEPDDVKAPYFRHLAIDWSRRVSEIQPGIVVPLHPFMGIYAVAPDEDGPVPTAFPGAFGGNMDCKELVAGTTLYLPVFVPGALFSTGDGHAAQGDGEVNVTGIEAGMERVELQFVVRKDFAIEHPCAETPTHLIFLGFGDDLDAALLVAARDVMRYLVAARGLTWDEAYSLASIAIDFRITQVVDGPRGVHAMLPKEIFTSPPLTFATAD